MLYGLQNGYVKAKEFGVQVWAYDLWINATDNWNRIKHQGFESKLCPIHGDARNIPYKGFFDVIISVDSYIYFGTDDLYLNYLQQFLVPGGTLGIVMPGLMKDFENGVPEHLKDFWGQDYWSCHTVDWWKKLWERTELVDIKVADTMPEGCMMYVKWKEAQDKVGKNPCLRILQFLKRMLVNMLASSGL